MSRWAVFSDTHGDLSLLPAALSKAGELDGFIHLGDHANDAERIASVTGLPFHAVRGNCDWSSRYPLESVVQIENIRLFLCHGHSFRDIWSICRRAEEEHCDIALQGHTHVPLFTAQGALLILNPGSLSRPRSGSACACACLELEGKSIRVKMIRLDYSDPGKAEL